MLVNLPIPASAQIFCGYLLQIVSFDVIPTDDFYDNYFNIAPTVALTENFQSLGYESKYFLRNLGSIGAFFLFYLIALIISALFGKCKSKHAYKIHKWMQDILVWNQWFHMVDDAFLVLVVSTMIQLLQFSTDDLISPGAIANFCCAAICAPLLFIHIILVGCIFTKNFKRIQTLDQSTKKFNSLFQNLKIRTNLTNRVLVQSGKESIQFCIWNFIRKIILGVTLTTMTDWPLYCVFIMNFCALTQMIIVGYVEPFKDPVRRIMDLFNEFLVLVIIYHLLCFTNFVSDPTMRDYLGYSLTVVTFLFIAINMGYAFHIISINYCLKVKYWCIKNKNLRERNRARKQYEEALQEYQSHVPSLIGPAADVDMMIAVKARQVSEQELIEMKEKNKLQIILQSIYKTQTIKELREQREFERNLFRQGQVNKIADSHRENPDEQQLAQEEIPNQIVQDFSLMEVIQEEKGDFSFGEESKQDHDVTNQISLLVNGNTHSQDLLDKNQPAVKQHEGIEFFEERVRNLPRTNIIEEEQYWAERQKLSVMKAKNSPYITTELM